MFNPFKFIGRALKSGFKAIWKVFGPLLKSEAFEFAGNFFPSAVSGEPDAMESYDAKYDEDGNIIREAGEQITPMTVSRDILVPVLVKAIQELSAKVTALENA